MRPVLLGLVAVLVAAGCQAAPATGPDSGQFRLGEVFALGIGQDAIIVGEGLRIKFDQLLADSRCPRQVQCVWTGEARISVLVQQADARPVTVEFDTNPAPDQNRQTARVGPYAIALRSLDPYPETPEKILSSDYRAALLVSKE
jgi:hypothetical protein